MMSSPNIARWNGSKASRLVTSRETALRDSRVDVSLSLDLRVEGRDKWAFQSLQGMKSLAYKWQKFSSNRVQEKQFLKDLLGILVWKKSRVGLIRRAWIEILKGCRWKVSLPLNSVFLLVGLHSQVRSLIRLTKWLLMEKSLPCFLSSQFRNPCGKRASLYRKFQWCFKIESHWWVWVVCPCLNQSLSPGSERSLFHFSSLSMLSYPGS